MRDTDNMKWQALEFEVGFNLKENDEWNTYASDDDFEESNYDEFKV